MMRELAQILAFYSFKGGVGRSMAVLNLAYSLARKGGMFWSWTWTSKLQGSVAFSTEKKK